METNAQLSEALSNECIPFQLQLMDENKLQRAKKFLEVITKSERVKINKYNQELYVDKVPTGLKSYSFILYLFYRIVMCVFQRVGVVINVFTNTSFIAWKQKYGLWRKLQNPTDMRS